MIVNTDFLTDQPNLNTNYLDDEQRQVFMEVIADSLRVSQRTHLFNWLQAGFQYLLAHEIMIFGIKSQESSEYSFEYFSSSRYFNDARFNEVIEQGRGLLIQALELWKNTNSPLLFSSNFEEADYNNYSAFKLSEADLKASELNSFIVHGFGDHISHISTFVAFARLSKGTDNHEINTCHAHILELIMPHLHCGLIRVTSSRGNLVFTGKTSKKITKRESEILHWVHMGKTNWEISGILTISPLTVKNHVQNILRKLDVQNRGQAAVKASKLGLVKILR